MSNPSLDEVFRVDQLLYQLASYEVSGGKLIVPNSIEAAFKFQKKTAEKFNYFKSLIQKGECSIDFIKNKVLTKNGPFPKEPFVTIDNLDSVNNVATDKPEELSEDFFNRLFKLLAETDNDKKSIVASRKKSQANPPLQLPEKTKDGIVKRKKSNKSKK
jgi:hypothetical protein